jgi:DNA-binding Lrp family transcriptional regulator
MSSNRKAFVLLRVSPGHEYDVIDSLMALPEVAETHIVPGDWDILAVVAANKDLLLPGDEKVYKLVMDKISRIKHVQDTNTMVSQYSKSK